jgi:3-phosphoshikimate 1-carboxyvinyltransferase
LLISNATHVPVASVGDPALHPDGAILDAFAQVGLTLARTGELATLQGELAGALDVSARGMPDSMLTLAALACVLDAPSTFRELGILRHKESDRVASMQALVQAASGRTELHGETLRVLPPRNVAPLVLDSAGDHRLAMSAATLAVLAGVPLRLSGADCVEKSFPTFFRELELAGVTFELG